MRMTLMAIVLVLMPAVGVVQDLERGLAAARAGDYATALKEWKPLADQGNASAQYDLGKMYQEGHGVGQDYAEAARWYGLSAEQGFAPAQSALGSMYVEGEGVTRDQSEAARWFHLAAAQGYIPAQFNLGFLYAYGHGVAQDYVAAHIWFGLVADFGREGFGVNQDVIKFASNNRVMLEKRMSPEQIAEASQKAKACRKSNYRDCTEAAVANSSGSRRHHSFAYGWSVQVPAAWLVDSLDQAFVKLEPPNQRAICGIHSNQTRFATLGDFADFMQDYMERLLKEESGLTSQTTSREEVSILSGLNCVRSITELEPGGRSMRTYCVANGTGFAIDCETSVLFWGEFSDTFNEIHSSFTIE